MLCAVTGCAFVAITAGLGTVAAQTTEQNLATNTGAIDFFRPPPNLFQMSFGDRTAPGTTRDVTTQTLNLRYDHAFDLQSGWILTTRSDLPMLAKNPLNDLNPTGDYVRGIGDADVQAALIHNINQRWAFGFGMRLIAPTGNELLASGTWQLMPIVGARLALPEISSGSYFEPLLRYAVSVAGDPTQRNIRNFQFAPILSINLPDRWYVTFFPTPDIRINYGDPITGQTGRWFVPFDIRVGRKFTENVAMSLEVGVPIIKDYPLYNFKTQLRLNVTYWWRQSVEFTYVIMPAAFTMPEARFTWPGIIMILTPTPMKTEILDAGRLFKAEHLPSLHLSLEVTRGQFSDMLRMLEAKRLKDLHFTVEDGANDPWPVFSWGMSAALA